MVTLASSQYNYYDNTRAYTKHNVISSLQRCIMIFMSYILFILFLFSKHPLRKYNRTGFIHERTRAEHIVDGDGRSVRRAERFASCRRRRLLCKLDLITIVEVLRRYFYIRYLLPYRYAVISGGRIW